LIQHCGIAPNEFAASDLKNAIGMNRKLPSSIPCLYVDSRTWISDSPGSRRVGRPFNPQARILSLRYSIYIPIAWPNPVSQHRAFAEKLGVLRNS
jgi:hypothetical protein